MASENMSLELSQTDSPKHVQMNSWSKEDRKKNKKLRHAGLEYISRSGRTIAAKKQPDVICNCPQQCSAKVPKDIRERLFADFYALADANSQNAFLQRYIEIRSVNKRLYNEERKESGRLQRRVTCKYRVPLKLPPRNNVETPAISQSSTVIDTLRENAENSEINESSAGIDTSIENADVGTISEESDDDEEKVEMNGEMGGNKSGDDEKKEIKGSSGLIEPEKNEETNKNTTVDPHESDSFCNGNTAENTESSLSKTETREHKSELTPNSIVPEEKTQPEEPKLESNVADKENETKSDASTTPITENNPTTSLQPATVESTTSKDVVEICQKAFMNIFAITEKRVRLQRERIIDNLRAIAEKREAEQEEMENTISVARELAAGCRPLLYFMDKSNQSNRIPSLPNKLLMAIDNDITLVNNFFRNQLWKPENFNKKYKCDAQSETEILD